MTDLLVSSLMADGGLETALNYTFRRETLDMEELKVLTKYIGSYTFLLRINSGLLKFVFKRMHM